MSGELKPHGTPLSEAEAKFEAEMRKTNPLYRIPRAAPTAEQRAKEAIHREAETETLIQNWTGTGKAEASSEPLSPAESRFLAEMRKRDPSYQLPSRAVRDAMADAMNTPKKG